MRQRRRKRTPHANQPAEVLEQRALLTDFVGTASATFENAEGPEFSGLGTSTFNWGRVYLNNALNEFNITTNAIDVTDGQKFSLGTLDYYNGIVLGTTGTAEVDLVIQLDLTAPELEEPTSVEKRLRMVATLNDGTPEENADTVFLGGEAYTNFEVGRTTYALNVLGFGTIDDNEFTPIDKVVVLEEESTSVELIAEFIPLSDLRPTRIISEDMSVVGQETDFKFIVANRGRGTAEDGFTAQVVMSSSPTIEDGNYMVIQEVETTRNLKPGRRVTMRGTFTLPEDMPQDYAGEVYLAVVIDPNNEVNEADEDNNMPRRMSDVDLFDPVAAPHMWSDSSDEPLTFRSRRKALNFLNDHGYDKHRQDQGSERSIALDEHFSRRTGEMVDAGAFRTVAKPMKDRESKMWMIEVREAVPTRAGDGQWRDQFASGAEAGRYLRLWEQMAEELF